MVMRGRPGGHRSGAGSNKCTEVANGKHNTKIDKLLQHELNDAETCKNCTPPKPQDTGARSAATSPNDPPANQEEPDSDGEGEEDEEGEEDGHGDGAADTKKKGHTH
ncbi:hypothetical protein PFTANZ_06680 [Plasmodium falciparum Tanzania (2000708)]|uniref:Uncharacterized protein n=1 Tax=Plasmodium falciparum Tanzania (2000708) TaxID=1036725 RepID=A0A024VWI2_PLAFA|nr:hypothetical protein PFTANZ_06680 [Plasmodium falciparum Tanzania (2000708)]